MQLKNLVLVISVVYLLQHLEGFRVHGAFIEALSVVELVRVEGVTIWEELRQLVVTVCGTSVILHLEITVTEQGEGGTVPG